MEEKNLLISFSGGETSGYMAQWILNNWQDKYDNFVVVFANTGEENEETLEFVKQCDEYFGFNVVWVEAVVRHGERKGTTHKVVDFDSASRNGEPFEEVIKKYGIPNQAFPHCTRELKTAPITSYVKNELGWRNYYTAIGIRSDEFDRMDAKMDEKRFVYPLCSENMSSKKHVNYFWSEMPFRLQLKGYQGNCKACWKKSLRKLMTIAAEDEGAFENMRKWEDKYGDYTPASRTAVNTPYTFYRNNMSAEEIIELANSEDFEFARDDSVDTYYQKTLFGHELDGNNECSESCEPF